MDGEYNPLLKRKPRKPTEAEILAWRELSRDPGLPWDRLPDIRPYVAFGKNGPGSFEIGVKGSF